MALQALVTYPDDVRFVYHHFPATDSQLSMKIAESLEEAGAQGKFWEMHDQIVLYTPLDITELKMAAASVGLDMDDFNEAIDTGKHTETVLQAKELAKEHDVEYVALFINQKEFDKNPGSFDNLKEAIEEELVRIGADGQI